MKRETKPALGVATASTSAKTTLHLFAENTKGADRSALFGLVSERIRTCMLDSSEAAFIAAWFDRLAAGEDPKRVFYGETRGRKRGSTGTKYVRGTDVQLPDHIDLCWNMRRAISQHDPETVFAAVAKVYSVTPDYVREIWEREGPTLAPDPKLLTTK